MNQRDQNISMRTSTIQIKKEEDLLRPLKLDFRNFWREMLKYIIRIEKKKLNPIFQN